MEKHIDLQGHQVFYESTNKGQNALVFIHGANSSRKVWRNQMQLQIPTYKNISIDLLGYGQSDQPEIVYSLELWLGGIHEVLEKEQVQQACLIAHSNGVILAKEYYRAYPDQIQGLILLDGMLKPLIITEKLQWMKNALERPDYEEFMQSMAKYTPVQGLSEEEKQLVIENNLSTPKHLMAAQLDLIMQESTWKDIVIQCPSVIVHTDNPMWDTAYLEDLSKIFENYRLEDWGNTNHFLMFASPNKLNQLIADFLN